VEGLFLVFVCCSFTPADFPGCHCLALFQKSNSAEEGKLFYRYFDGVNFLQCFLSEMEKLKRVYCFYNNTKSILPGSWFSRAEKKKRKVYSIYLSVGRNFMKATIFLTIFSLTILSCSTNQNNKDDMGFFDKLFGKKDSTTQSENKVTNLDTTNTINTDYQSKLLSTKQFYPFTRWRESYNDGLTQYTKENCDKTQKVFDDLIASLLKIGENASEQQKKELFKTAILKTNQLNEEIDGLIETGEREDLCDLTDKITIACGLDPHKYGDGEGVASEWRDW
jgi:hypothetical protein